MFSGAVPRPAVYRCLGKAGFPDFLEQAQGQQAKEKEKSVWEAEQLQASGPEGGRLQSSMLLAPELGGIKHVPRSLVECGAGGKGI